MAVAFAAMLLALGRAAAQQTAQQEAGLAAVNAARQAAGLNRLRLHPLLSRAAADHARYLARNGVRGHEQRTGRPGFTGRLPADRARHAGYATAGVSENIAQGAATAGEAVDGLLTAIYHRFAFLAFDIDELGVGRGPGDPKEAPWVFTMSDGALNAWCVKPPAAALFTPPGTYTVLCPGGARLKADAVEAQRARLPLANPPWVLWPPPGYDHTPPAFFQETPDPLPDREISGYPVSIQFNRAKVPSVLPRAFRLSAVAPDGTERPVTALRRLDQRTDPNRRFSALDFAWFPLERLAWNTAYRVTAEFEVDGRRHEFAWEFHTRDPGLPVITVTGPQAELALPAGVEHALYIPPTARAPRIQSFRWTTHGEARLEADGLDPNTLRVRLSGPPCAKAELALPGGQVVRLRVAPGPGKGPCP